MFAALVQYLPLLLSSIHAATEVKAILDQSSSNASIVDKVKATLPTVAPVLEQLGAALFPKAAPEIHIAAGALAAFDKNVVIWIQNGCNTILGTHLQADGIYGEKTKAAVEQLQTKLGLKLIDGFAGRVTQAALDAALTALQKKA